VPFRFGSAESGDVTAGHRFMAPAAFTVRGFADYAGKLAAAKVILDPAERRARIEAGAKALAEAQGLRLRHDPGLLDEVAGLVEWPVPLLGRIDAEFMDIPPEVLVGTMRQNQKYLALETADGRLADRFVVVANIEAPDGGAAIVAGNERVLRARFWDARHFWELDRRQPLEAGLPKLERMVFHAELGSQGQRVQRLVALVGALVPFVPGADRALAERAALLAKADLVTGMVGEFPELQGLMGRYYALEEGHDEEVADAIRDHYKPVGPSDNIPVSKIGQAVALADKLDTLVGFWLIDEKPTGSKDPYALRRSALGIIRTLLQNGIRLGLIEASTRALKLYFGILFKQAVAHKWEPAKELINDMVAVKHRGHLKLGTDDYRRFKENKTFVNIIDDPNGPETAEQGAAWVMAFIEDLLAFFADRLKVYLKDQGARHDLIDAVFALGNQDDLLMIVKRVEALSKFLDTDDGRNLLAGVKRAANILKIEEKKDGRTYDGDVQQIRLIKGEEKALHSAITIATGKVKIAVEHEDFEAAMAALAKLRAPVDAFFDHVTVNDKDEGFRINRLKLLNRIRQATMDVADFSRIEG